MSDESHLWNELFLSDLSAKLGFLSICHGYASWHLLWVPLYIWLIKMINCCHTVKFCFTETHCGRPQTQAWSCWLCICSFFFNKPLEVKKKMYLINLTVCIILEIPFLLHMLSYRPSPIKHKYIMQTEEMARYVGFHGL